MHPKALAHYQEGLAFQEQGDFNAARDAYLRALELDARHEESRLKLLDVLLRLGDFPQAEEQAKALLDQQPNNYDVAYLYGVALSRLGRLGEAVGSFQRALFISPGFAPALEALIAIYRQQGNLQGELDMLDRLVSLDETNARSRFELADALVKAGRAAEALKPLREALAREPESISGFLLLADIEGRLGNGEEAWKILQSVAGRAPDTPGVLKALLALCRQQAMDAGLTNNPAIATQWWERLLAIAPDDAEALSRLERLYTSQTRMGDLVRLMEQFAGHHPDDSSAILRLAEALAAIGRKQDALFLYKKTLQKQPDNDVLRSQAIELAMELDLPQEARNLVLLGRDASVLPAEERLRYAKAKALEGQKEEAWSLLEGILDDPQQGQSARLVGRNLSVRQAEDLGENPLLAINWWERALQCKSDDERAACEAAVLYRQLDRGTDAVRVLRALPNRYKDPDLLREFAASCEAANLFDEAHEAFTALMAREGDTTGDLLHLIDLSLAASKPGRAWDECEKIKRSFPEFPKLRTNQARISHALALEQEKAGDYAEAVTWWRQHVAFDPDSPERKRLAQAQIATGDLKGAMLSYRAWLRRHSTDVEVALWLGNYELDQGVYSDAGISTEAREYFELALDLRPNNIEALFGLAQVAEAELADDEALKLYGRILALDKSHIPAAMALAKNAYQRKDDLTAWNLIKRILAKNPENPSAKTLAISALKRLTSGKFEEPHAGWWERFIATAISNEFEKTAQFADSVEWWHPFPFDDPARMDVAWCQNYSGDLYGAKLSNAAWLKAYPGDIDLALELGNYQLEHGLYSDTGIATEAWAFFESVLETHPQSVEALTGLARMAEAELDEERSCAFYRLVLEVDPNNAEALKATAPKIKKKPPRSVDPNDPDDLAAFSIEQKLEAGAIKEAYEACEQFKKASPDSPKLRPTQAKLALAMAKACEGANNFVEAVKWWRQHVTFDPETSERIGMAQAQIATGDLNGAMLTYRSWLRRHPEDLEAAIWLGNYELEQGVYSDAGISTEAREYFEGVLEQDPHHVEGLYGLARVAEAELNDEEALELYRRILALDSLHVPSALALAHHTRRSGDDKGAWELLKRAIASNPDHAEARNAALSLLKRIAGNHPDEPNWWEEILALDPEDPEAIKTVAKATTKRSDATSSEVAKAILEVLQADPEDLEARLFLVQQAFDSGQLAEAQSLIHTPELLGMPAGMALGAQIAIALGDFQTAHQLLDELQRVEPCTPLTVQCLCELAIAEGNIPKAWERLQSLSDDVLTTGLARALAIRVARHMAEQARGEATVPYLEALLRWDPRDLDAHFSLAEIQRDLGRTDQAVIYLKAILAIDPTSVRAALLAADLLSKDGMFAEALKVLAPLGESGNEVAFILAGRIHQLSGNRALARTEYERVIQHLPLHQEARLALAEFAAEEADGSLAWHHLQTLMSAQPQNQDLRAKAHRLLIELARRLEPQSAIVWWREVYAFDPEDLDVQAIYATLLKDTGQIAEAADLLERILARAPHQLALALDLGAYYRSEGLFDKARSAFGIAAQGGDPSALKALGEISRQEGQFLQAAAWLAKAFERLPDDTALLLELAEALFASGLFEEAAERLDMVLDRWPDHPGALALRLKLLRETARHAPDEAALGAWRTLSDSNPQDIEAHQALMRLGLALDSASDVETALRRISQIDPNDSSSALSLGLHLLRQENQDQAKPLLERAAEQGAVEAFAPLAQLEYQAGNDMEALSWVRLHLEAFPQDTRAWRMRQAIARAHGDEEGEWEALTALTDLGDPTAPAERLALCNRLIRARDPQEAMPWIERGFALSPGPGELPAQAVAALGLFHQTLGRSEDALAAFLWAAEAQEPAAVMALARLAKTEGDFSSSARWLSKALEAKPTDAALILELAEVLLADSTLPEAYELLAPYVELYPQDARAGLLLQACLQGLSAASEAPEAYHWLRELTRRFPEDLDAWRRFAGAAEQQGRQAEHDEALERLSILDPQNLAGVEALGRHRLKSGRVHEALTLLERVASAGRLQAYLPTAEVCLRLGEIERAKAWLLAFEGAAPGRSEALYVRLALARAEGNAEAQWAALEALEKHLSPADTPTLRMARLGLAWQGIEGEEAIGPWLDRALRLAPAEEELSEIALLELGQRYLNAGKPDQARHAYGVAARRDNLKALAALGQLAQEAKDWPTARQSFARALELEPDQPTLQLALAETLVAAGIAREAQAVLKALLARDPAHERAMELQKGVLRAVARAAPADEALECWRSLSNSNPEDLEAHRQYQDYAQEAGLDADRLVALERLYRLSPTEEEVAFELGRIYQTQGRVQESKACFEQAASIGNARAFAPLADLCFQSGEFDGAQAWLLRHLEVEPRDPKAWRLRHALALQLGNSEDEWTALTALEEQGDPFAHGERLALCFRQIEEGDPGKRLSWAERGFGLGPRRRDLPAEAIAELGVHLEAQGRRDEAHAALQWAAEDLNPIALRALARMARMEGNRPAAISHLESLLAEDFCDLDSERELIDVLLEEGALVKAYERLIPLRERLPADEGLEGMLRSCLERLIQETDGAQAFQWTRHFVAQFPDDLGAWRSLAARAQELGLLADAEEALEQIVRLDQSDHAGALTLGLRKLDAGKPLEAQPFLERAAIFGSTDAYLPLLQACVLARHPQAARQWLAAFEDASLGHHEALLARLGIAMLEADAEARWQALAVLESLPQDTPTIRMVRLGLAWQQIEALADAGPWLDRALRLGPTEEELPPKALVELGRRYTASGQMDKARHAFAGAASRGAHEAMLALARIEAKAGALAEANVWYQKARMGFTDPVVLVEHAEVLAKLGQLVQALSLLRAEHDLSLKVPRALDLLANLLRSLALESSGPDSFQWWQELHALFPQDSEALRHLVYLADEQGEKATALNYLELLVEADPEDAESALALGQVRFANGEFAAAAPFLRRAAAAGLVDAYLPLSKVMLALGEASEARNWISAFAAIAPETPELWECRRALATKEDDPEGEWQAMSRLSQLQPENPGWPVVMLTHCRSQFGQPPSEAWPWFERARELCPQDPELYRLRADCLSAMGDKAGALESYRSAYELGERHASLCQAFLDEAERAGLHAEAYHWAHALYEADPLHPSAYDQMLLHARAEAQRLDQQPEALPWWIRVHAAAARDLTALQQILARVRGGETPEEASVWAQRLLEIAPTDPDALSVSADEAIRRGDRQTARTQLEALLSSHPAHVPSLFALSRLERQQGHLAPALARLRQIQQLDPQHPKAMIERIGILLDLGQFEEAYGEAEPYFGALPDLANLLSPRLLELARQAERSGEAAFPLWMRLLHVDPLHGEALRTVSRHLSQQGRPAEALPHLYALAKMSTDPNDQQLLAETLLAANRKQEARAILMALARESNHLPAWATLGELELAEGQAAAAMEIANVLLAAGVEGASDLAARAALAVARQIDPQVQPNDSLLAWQRVLAFNPGEPEALLGAARASAALGDIQGAVADLEALLSDRPDWSDAKALLAECLLLAGEAARAEALYHDVLAQRPDHPIALLALARSAQARGEFVIAGDYCQRVMKLDEPDAAERARVLAAYCARQLAEAARLRRDFDQAFLYADLLRAYQAPSLDLMRFGAELARDAGRRPLAAAQYRRLLLAHPEAFEESLQLARCFEDPAEAMPALEALWMENQPLAAAYALATLAGDQANEEVALEWWKRGIAQSPHHPVLLRRAAEHCRRHDCFAEACEYFGRLAAVTTYDPSLLRTWGSTALRGERDDLAREPFERLARDHDDSEASLTLAEILTRLGEDEAAWQWAQTLRDGDQPAQAESLSEAIAKRMAERSPDPDAALIWWDRYLELVPGDVPARLQLGAAYLQLGKLDLALAAFNFAADLSPELPDPLWYRGETLRRMGTRDEAREAYLMVLQETPHHGPSRYALAEMAWEEGNLQTVWELGQQLLEDDSQNQSAIELISRCARQLAQEAQREGVWANAALYWELLLTYAPEDSEALAQLAEAYVQLRRFAEAVGIQREMVRLHPQETAIKFRLGEIAAMGRFFQEARECFEQLKLGDPTSAEIHQALAIVALGLDEPLAAAQHYRNALEVAPDHLGCTFGLGRLLLAEGQLLECWDPLQMAVELSKGDSAHAEVVALTRHAADRLSERASSKRLWDEAISYRRAAVALTPEDPSVRRALALTCYEAGRKAEAIDELTRLIAADPSDHDASFLLGEIHHQSGDLAGARRFFQSILEQEPLHFQTRLTMAQLAWEAGEYDSAWNHLQAALTTRPDEEEAIHLLRKLALAFAERSQTSGDFNGAIRWWQEAWAHDRTDVELLRKIARGQVTIGHLSGAAETYATLLDADPKDLETAHILADIHRQRGDLRSAEGPLLRIVALDPRHVPSLRALMLLARDRQNPPEALKRAYALLDVEPQNLEALLLLAWSHEQMMERRAAQEVCKDILAIDPQHAEAHHSLGRLARDLGDLELAKKSLSSAIYYAPRASYYHTMGTIYKAMGLEEEALAAFGQALVLDPENAEAHADLGLGFLQKALLDKAKNHLQRARKLLPADNPRSLELQCALDLIG